MLEPIYSRQRQKRLLDVIQKRELDAMVLGLAEHVYYASAHRSFWLRSAAMVLLADGTAALFSASKPDQSAADQIINFEASWNGTQRQEQPRLLAELVKDYLKSKHCKRMGMDASAVTSQLVIAFEGDAESIDDDLWQVRRSKLPDELALIRTAVKSAAAMYHRAKQIIEPGLAEVELFQQLHAAAVLSTGEPMTALLGNDYACGVGGGPPRADHRAKAGQLWILDLGPSYRGYFADTCRTFSVDRKPTDLQLKTAEAIASVFPLVESLVKPGVACQDVFRAVEEHLKDKIGHGLSHHLGHGVGLQPHEFPHLNLKWNDVFIEGDVFTAEPGIYSQELNGGIRLENQYVVTTDGVQNLIDFPLSLV